MKTILSWSSGKDSAWCLHVLRQDPGIELMGLVTTVNEHFGRVAMHGVPVAALRAQAQATGLPLHEVLIPHPCPNAVYEERMGRFVEKARAAGAEAIAFGDLFLEDIRAWREARLAGTGLTPLFPLWQRDTARLAGEMIAAGLRAWITTVDPRAAPRDFAGRLYDDALIEALPEGVDPCGERGEFHSFAFAGPMFVAPIPARPGRVVEREGFIFADLVLSRGQHDPSCHGK